ncbi:MAG: DUF502 domain-containing protein [Candidatus Zixiibacteriota bacterium]
MSPEGSLTKIFKKYVIAGVLVIVPLIITYVVLRFLLSSIDGLLSPALMRYLGYDIPGLGIVIVVLLIIITGVLTHGVIGRQLVAVWDGLLGRVPLVRTIYVASKQLLQSITNPNESMFQRVVIVPYPRSGMYTLAFASSEVTLDTVPGNGSFVAVFVPSTPTPFTGFTLLVKKEEVYPTSISVEDAVKFIVSGGIVAPGSVLPQTRGGVQGA